MKVKKIPIIVDNQTMKELFGLSDKSVTRERKIIRTKFGLTTEEKITTYHLAKHLRTPLKYIERKIVR